jgi:Ca2+-binding EF-hand superfamily protein
MAASNYDAQASTNYKEAFALFDKRGNQRVQLESLGDLLRACGQNPTLAEIRELEKSVAGNDCKIMSFSSIHIHIHIPAPHPYPISAAMKKREGLIEYD